MRGGGSRIGRWVCVGGGLAVVALAVLVGPAGTWLQARGHRPPADAAVDLVYLVAGGKDQSRRIEALAEWVAGRRADGARAPVLAVANDRAVWNPAGTGGVTRATLAQATLEERFPALPVRRVAGHFTGTDGEMAALARDLRERGGVGGVVLVTSPFHARRARGRLVEHAAAGLRVYVIVADSRPVDRAPWVVGAELAKMVRDAAGFSRHPLLSRPERWVR